LRPAERVDLHQLLHLPQAEPSVRSTRKSAPINGGQEESLKSDRATLTADAKPLSQRASQ
jgi:hypothetical protein